MSLETGRLERKYRLELGRLLRLQKRKDFTPQGEYEFNRQLQITTAAKDKLLEAQRQEYALR